MNKQIKKDRLSIIAIILSIGSIIYAHFRVETLTLSDSWLAWAIGVSVTIMSIGVVIVLGYQIYNSATLDKRMKEMFDERTNKVKEDLSISAAKASVATLYQATGIGLKVDYATKDFSSMIRTLNTMSEYAISLNEEETLSDIARLIVNCWEFVDRGKPHDKHMDNSFLKLALGIQSRISASDIQAPRLLYMIHEIQSDKPNASQPKS